MSDTQWQIKEDKRFQDNIETVRKISEKFGLELRSFNPDWCFEPTALTSSNYSNIVSDDFMGKVAVSLGYKWNFNNDIYEEIIKQEEHIKQLELRIIERNERDTIIIEKHKEYQLEIDINNIIELQKEVSKFDIDSLLESKKILNKLKKVVEIRNELFEKREYERLKSKFERRV